MRMGLKRALGRDMLEVCASTFRGTGERFDFAVIANPTTHHAASYAAIRSSASKIFIEKPLSVPDPTDTVLCGYVLLHHPLQARLRQLTKSKKPSSINVTLNANTVLSANTGWRGRLASGGGVINEFGSHLFSLIVDIAGPLEHIAIVDAEVVHSVDAPDRAKLEGVSADGTIFCASLDWSNRETRKPVYAVDVAFTDGSNARHDFYEFSYASETMSVADLSTGSGAYLRGVEFTAQARYFLEENNFSSHVALAVEVDRVLGIVRDYSRG